MFEKTPLFSYGKSVILIIENPCSVRGEKRNFEPTLTDRESFSVA